MKNNNYLAMSMCAALACLTMNSCSDEMDIVNEQAVNNQCFSLTVTAVQPEGTRVAIGEDGFSGYWEKGEKIVLLSKTSNLGYTLTNNLTEPAKTATFTSSVPVPIGEYLAVSTTYGNPVFLDVSMFGYESGYSNGKGLSAIGDLTVVAGQHSAEIAMKMLHAQMAVSIKNGVAGNSYNVVMANPKTGITFAYAYSPMSDGFILNELSRFYCNFTEVNGNGVPSYSYMLPNEMAGDDITLAVFDVSDKSTVYIQDKVGIDIKGGGNYKLEIDLNECKAVRIENNEVRTVDEYNAAALRSTYYLQNPEINIMSDIDFTGKKVFPLNKISLNGNGHTLTGIVMDYPDKFDVGLFGGLQYQALDKISPVKVNDLVIKDSEFTGLLCVGAIAGIAYNATISNCALENVKVTATDELSSMYGAGGIVGQSGSTTISNCRVNNSIVEAAIGNAGGITGYCQDEITISQCYVNADVRNTSIMTTSVGGLVGNNHNRKTIIDKCSVRGTVSSNNMGGGFIGLAQNCKISNSYVLADLSGCLLSGGFVGQPASYYDNEISNCYFANSVKVPLFSSLESYNEMTVRNCVSVDSRTTDMNTALHQMTGSYLGVSNIGDFLSTLNDPDNAFSTTVFDPQSQYNCPLLRWECEMDLNQGIGAPSLDPTVTNW